MTPLDPGDTRSLPERIACLGAAPGHWHFAWCVSADGGRWPWLIDPTADDGDTAGIGAPHEQLGPLPARWQARLDQTRCGRPRHDGQPCRTPTGRPGDPCHWHRAPIGIEETP